MAAWTALGIVTMFHDIEEYRWQQQAIADFDARMPKMIGEAPYDPSVGKRLIGEAAGCVITIVVAVFGVRRRRRGAVEVRVKWIATPATRVAPVKSASVATGPPVQLRAEPTHKVKSGSLAADRLSVIVWSDHVARLKKELA